MSLCDIDGCESEAVKYIGIGLTRQALCLPHYLEHRKSPPPIQDTARLRAEQEREALRRAVVVVEVPVVPVLPARKPQPKPPKPPKPLRAPKPAKKAQTGMRTRLLEWVQANNGGRITDAQAYLGCHKTTLYRTIRFCVGHGLDSVDRGGSVGRLWLEGTKPASARPALDLTNWQTLAPRSMAQRVVEAVRAESGLTNNQIAARIGCNVNTVSQNVAALRRCGVLAPDNARRGVHLAGTLKMKLSREEELLLRIADYDVFPSSDLEKQHSTYLFWLRSKGLVETVARGQSRITEAGLVRAGEIRRRIEAGEVECPTEAGKLLIAAVETAKEAG